jgi:signal transduction histidine kinase/DNA-binding CsgD family transcriptional regulator
MREQAIEWSARDRERRDLARALHEQLEPALLLLVEQARTYQAVLPSTAPQARNALNVLASMAAGALAHLQEIVVDLEARELRHLGLIPALEILSLRTERRYGLSVRLDLPGRADPTVRHLSAERAHAAYRIAQEAMHNAGRHAGAGQLEVSMRLREGHLVLVIADDGRGFCLPEGPEAAGEGLREMAARAASVGGTLEVSSVLAVGTQVRATLPLAGLASATRDSAPPGRRLPEPLTSREREVLSYVVKGMTNKQIAASLGISDRTVQFHLGNVLHKLDVASRTGAAVIALAEGLI